TFIQVFLISMVNASASLLYIYMQFVRISEFLIVLGQFLWMSAHGLPAVIYLLMNDTIRRDCKKMLLRVKNVVSIHPPNIPDVCAAQPETVAGEAAGALQA
ncbi:Protein SRT-41, partial [Aphelenchoides avenae]